MSANDSHVSRSLDKVVELNWPTIPVKTGSNFSVCVHDGCMFLPGSTDYEIALFGEDGSKKEQVLLFPQITIKKLAGAKPDNGGCLLPGAGIFSVLVTYMDRSYSLPFSMKLSFATLSPVADTRTQSDPLPC